MDALKETGKRLNKTQKRGVYSESDHPRNFPLIERSRDSFDCNFDFTMEIATRPEQKTRITFIFMQPYLSSDCGGG